MTQRPQPPSLRAASACACLLVRSWRLVVAGGADCPIVPRDFRGACGGSGSEVCTHFFTFLWALAAGARRRLRIHPPGIPELSADEQCVLDALAAAQENQSELLALYMDWLACPAGRRLVRASTEELAGALKAQGLLLALPAA